MPNDRRDKEDALEVIPPPRTPAPMSAEVREFMGRPPHWLLQSGTTVLAAVLTLLLILSIVIRYPDTITARLSLTGTQPVVEVMARQSGHLESLGVQERQKVRKGDILAVIQSPSQPATVLALGKKLARLAPVIAGESATPDLIFKPEQGLGRLQDSYADFLSAYTQLLSVAADDYSQKAGVLLRQQLDGKTGQIASMRQQLATSRRELELARAKYDRMKVLHSRESISTAQLQEQEMAMLAQTRSDAAAQKNLTDAEIEAARMEKELRDLEHDRTEALRLARERVRVSLNKLRGEIDVWEADFVLRAPADGIVAFYDFWSDQQFVTAGRQVFLIVPETTRLVGRMSVNSGGAGKIRPRQPVRIRFDDYPYKEFGIVSGRVQSVSIVAREGANLVLVDIPYPLTTSFNKRLQFKQDMTGEASIVTEDIRLIGRVLNEIRRAFVNNTRD
ncbi:MAG: HlyD family efflux transporter periplasmic adaptor subunit [Chthoniobacteraceae bacterium]